MAASPSAVDDVQENWGPSDEAAMGSRRSAEPNGDAHTHLNNPLDDRGLPDSLDGDYARGSGLGKADAYREKQVKPNKVYIGGLPEQTRMEDLQNCFGQIGNIVNIELKVGYGFVEFESRQAAEESVAKYHEGHFMGSKIRVELSHGGGRTAKYKGDPGACFKCGGVGHWARECPHEDDGGRRPYDMPPDRGRDYGSRDMPPRDSRYEYGGAPSRDYRRPPSPPRDYRDYPAPAGGRGRDYDDYRRGPPPAERYGGGGPPDRGGRYPPPDYRGPGGYGGPPPPGAFDRYDRRSNDRYASYGGPARGRSPPRGRDEYERGPPRSDYPDYRGRPPSPARYNEYPRPGGGGYRRRSESPPPRSSGSGYEQGYGAGGGYPSGGGGGGGYSQSGPSPGRSRDYLPPGRNGRDAPPAGGAPFDAGGYRRS